MGDGGRGYCERSQGRARLHEGQAGGVQNRGTLADKRKQSPWDPWMNRQVTSVLLPKSLRLAQPGYLSCQLKLCSA